MSKKHFIALADAIKNANKAFSAEHLTILDRFCRDQNPRFNMSRWLDYIDGKCGPNGGRIK